MRVCRRQETKAGRQERKTGLAAGHGKWCLTGKSLERLQQWIVALSGRIGYHKTLVAIANKHARQLWAVLAKGESYNPQAWQRA